MSTKDR